jgi:transcription elongation factor Elf1
MPSKEYRACLSCGLSVNVRIRVDGKMVQALRPPQDCPVCKRKVTVGVRPLDQKVYFKIKDARTAKNKEDEMERGEDENDGTGTGFIPRGNHRSPGLKPYEWDPAA